MNKLVYIASPQNWNRYAYVLNNPLALVDLDGREPNKTQAGTAQQIVAIVQQIERNNPGLNSREILERTDQFFREQGGGPTDTRYVYTQESGWIDFRHFFAAANLAADTGEFVSNSFGLGLELFQGITLNSSGFSYEDLGSNAAGADFGDDFFNPNGGLLSTQVDNYLNTLRPLQPTAAPNWTNLPNSEADAGSRSNQSSGGRGSGAQSQSRPGTTPTSSGGGGQPIAAPRSSGATTPAPAHQVSSSSRKRTPNDD